MQALFIRKYPLDIAETEKLKIWDEYSNEAKKYREEITILEQKIKELNNQMIPYCVHKQARRRWGSRPGVLAPSPNSHMCCSCGHIITDSVLKQGYERSG